MINSGGSGTVPADLPQGETEDFYTIHYIINILFFMLQNFAGARLRTLHTEGMCLCTETGYPVLIYYMGIHERDPVIESTVCHTCTIT